MENPNNNYQYQQLKSLKGGGSGGGSSSSKGKMRSSSSSKPMKVKYISSPMMVRASNASEFRAIVQELTGQNSDVVRSKLEEATGMGMAIINSCADDDGVVGAAAGWAGLHQCQGITSTAGANTTNDAAVLNLMDHEYDYVHDGTDRILPSCTHHHDHLNEAAPFWRELVSETLSGFQFPNALL